MCFKTDVKDDANQLSIKRKNSYRVHESSFSLKSRFIEPLFCGSFIMNVTIIIIIIIIMNINQLIFCLTKGNESH